MNPHDWRYILHADLDAFYASVEQLDNPWYRGQPLVVGGPPEGRGVVAAASYEARTYGIHSAMPMRTAMRLCSQLVRVSPRFDRYHEISRQVMEIFLELTPLVEPLSLDEAYLDISAEVGLERVDSVARGLRIKVKDEIGLVVSIGGGRSKTVAKVSSQLAKPDGLLLITPGEEQTFLAPLEVGVLWGVGPKTAEVFRGHGITTVGHLSASNDQWLRHTLGKRGPELKERALGIDHGQVTPHREAKSISAELTMSRDVWEEEELVERVRHLARGVASRLQRSGATGKTIFIKLRLADFTTLNRQRTISDPTSDEDVIAYVACGLLRLELFPGRIFRLVGVGVTGFQEPRAFAQGRTQQLPLLPQL
ncbi:DNA polymerase IV [SAR202 cluster bacterium AC-647-N09_OGT_505m]|nr:DNA polymerase IV [SAR202 cluster bacterium AC-647-N09_OGT_505m]